MTTNERNNKLILNKLEEIAYFIDAQNDSNCASSEARVKSLVNDLLEHFQSGKDLKVLLRSPALTDAISKHKEK
ncbi:hypothetical protein ACU5EH_05690 [Aliivibrio salmonicida]|uniref:hypothetical protein n=1 Tax=Aliivibrio salmonicida TaxID=40269 RepID=UPI00406C250C